MKSFAGHHRSRRSHSQTAVAPQRPKQLVFERLEPRDMLAGLVAEPPVDAITEFTFEVEQAPEDSAWEATIADQSEERVGLPEGFSLSLSPELAWCWFVPPQVAEPPAIYDGVDEGVLEGSAELELTEFSPLLWCIALPEPIASEAPFVIGEPSHEPDAEVAPEPGAEQEPAPTDLPPVDEQGNIDPTIIVCPGVVLPPVCPGIDGPTLESSGLLDEYAKFLGDNPTWLEDHGAGGIQAQVVTPSGHLPWVEMPTPGEAYAFDAWYALAYLSLPPADGSDPILEVCPGVDDFVTQPETRLDDAEETATPETDEETPLVPVPNQSSGGGTFVTPPVYSRSRTEFLPIFSRPVVTESAAGESHAVSPGRPAWMAAMGPGGFGGTSESDKPAKSKRRIR